MGKFVITLNKEENNKIYICADHVEKVSAYSVEVDGNVVSFEYPIKFVRTEAGERRVEGNTPVQSIRNLYEKKIIDTFYDKLYLIALEKEMLEDATALRGLMNSPSLKYSRTAIKHINNIKDYEDCIKALVEYRDSMVVTLGHGSIDV